MRLFGFDISRKNSERVLSPAGLADLLGQMGGSKSGANVNWKTALEVTTVLACVRVIAEGLAQVPFKLFRETPDGGREVAKDHHIYKLLTRRPNARQTSYEFRETIGLHLALCNDAFVFKVVHGRRVAELLPFPPNRVTVKRKGAEVTGYEVQLDDGARIPVAREDMWHLRGPSWDGVVGLEMVRLVREAVGLALATEEHSGRAFKNGARLGGVLSTDAKLTSDQLNLLRESWEKSQGGNENAFKTAILYGGLKWQSAAMQNDHAQLAELRRMQVEEICRAFRVMPIMVGYSDKTATYASAEQMFLAHVVHTLGPWYARLEQSADMNLLTEAEQDAGFYTKFITAGLMRGAHKDRAEYYKAALGAGGSPAWMTVDEIRSLEELNPMGGHAAILSMPTNQIAEPNE